MRSAITLSACSLLLMACHKDATGPKQGGVDPTVQITNELPADSVFFTWRDGLGIAGADTVPPSTTRCEKFTARPDSAYFQVSAVTPSRSDTVTAPWFDPSARVGFTVSWTAAGGPSVRDVSPTIPC